MIARPRRGFQERAARVGAVNVQVTTDTRLALRRLNVLRHGRQTCCGPLRRQVAMQTDRVHSDFSQHLGIGPPVRKVAGGAAFGLDRGVLVNEGTGRRRMAFGADRELARGRPKSFLSNSTMRIVAIRAVDQPLCNLVAKGHGELRLHAIVTLVAELRLRHLEQMLRLARGVDVMAADAAHVAFGVG